MPVSRKRAYSPIGENDVNSADAKWARMLNGYDGDSKKPLKKADLDTDSKKGSDSGLRADSKKSDLDSDAKKDSDSEVWADSKKSDADSDSLDCGDSGGRNSDLTAKADSDLKEDSKEASEVGRVDLSYLRKLHKGQVEKMSRNVS